MIHDINHPQHHTKKALFRQYTWWESLDGNRRVFVIAQRWHDNDGNIEFIELLEKDHEEPKKLPYQEFFNSFQKGLLKRTSKMEV